jgi:hypothetical protein
MSLENKKANAENDKVARAGLSNVYKAEKLRAAVAEAMKEDGMKEAVMEYIFSGDPDAVSPLEEIRKANK